MCRHVAYLGPLVPLAELLTEPPYGLLRQSWAPRRQRNGIMNADGFGVGWYAEGDPVPARYRRDRPMWTDANLPELARVVRSGAVLAAVRSGTDGMGHSEGAVAPFSDGRWLFSHNGAMPGWPACASVLAATLPPERLLRLDAASDSALLWAITHARLDGGAPLPEALSTTVAAASRAAPEARLNLLALDGAMIAATTWGDTLCWRADRRGVVVASEPSDDEPGWHDVPDHSLLTATPDGVRVTPLETDT
ncbi:MAG TPA: ergothioneine biosynthesis protein EgtC [Jatrophihabitantaceae bacterium]|jgi:glutamine amidotransferase